MAIPYLLHITCIVKLSSTITELGHYPLTGVTLMASLTTKPDSLIGRDARIIRSMHLSMSTFLPL